jgi:hypothetical protein
MLSFTVLRNDNVTVQCFDLEGRLVYQGQFSGSQSVTGVPVNPGVYILRASVGSFAENLKITVL